MKNLLKKMTAVLAVAVLTFSAVGCSSQEAETTAAAETTTTAAETTAAAEDTTAAAEDTTAAAEETAAEANEDLSGSLLMVGSTSMETMANALSEAFMIKYPNVSVSAEFVGSGAGIESLLAGTADIGNSSRALTDDEKASGAVENIVAIDGIAVVTDTANTVTDLTQEQLVQLYTGEITNWSDLGGEDLPVVVVGRESGSGTRSAFEEILGVEDTCAYSNELDSTGAVMAKVASTPGAIGYVSLDVIDDSVSVFTLEGVEANADNIKSGDYFLSRPFVMATMGEISEQNEVIQTWFDYLASEEGRAVIADAGLINVD